MTKRSYHLPPLQTQFENRLQIYEPEKRLQSMQDLDWNEIFELQTIKSVKELQIDYSEALAIKKGDLAII